MKAAALGILIAILPVFAFGQSPKQAPGRIVTTTRLVAIFSQLESDLGKAIQQNDQATLTRLLSDDFEVWTPTPPGQPIPREDWLQKAVSEKLQSVRVRQMAVRGIADDISVASFVLSETSASTGTSQTRDYFVIDVWKKAGEQWQITDRYQAAVSRPAATKAGDRKPTGKD